MDAEGASVERALRGDCIADTSLLSKFVNTATPTFSTGSSEGRSFFRPPCYQAPQADLLPPVPLVALNLLLGHAKELAKLCLGKAAGYTRIGEEFSQRVQVVSTEGE